MWNNSPGWQECPNNTRGGTVRQGRVHQKMIKKPPPLFPFVFSDVDMKGSSSSNESGIMTRLSVIEQIQLLTDCQVYSLLQSYSFFHSPKNLLWVTIFLKNCVWKRKLCKLIQYIEVICFHDFLNVSMPALIDRLSMLRGFVFLPMNCQRLVEKSTSWMVVQ